VEVFNESSSGNKLPIGKGKIAIKSAVPSLEKSFSFLIQLIYTDKKSKSSEKGQVEMTGKLQNILDSISNAEPRKADTIDSEIVQPSDDYSLVKGKKYFLIIDKLEAIDLLDTGSFLDQQDPSLSLKVGGVQFNSARY
jgi:hypothetical protein